MAHLRCDFFSETLGIGTSMTVVLPQRTTGQIGMAGASHDGPAPVLYLLHGLSDDDTSWVRRTSLERYADPLGIAVVMPQVHRSFYSDEVHGHRYWTFLSEELPNLVADFFRLSQRREDTFVAGLSMGGYGALKWALRSPERFAAAISLSGAVDVAQLLPLRESPEDPSMYARIFGDQVPAEDDLLSLVDAADPADLPALYLGCGTEDELLTANLALAEQLDRAGIPVTTSFRPGIHEWALWDEEIRRVLDWLPLSRQA